MRPEATANNQINSLQASLPPLQCTAGTGTAGAAVGLRVQEKDKRRSSQHTISTKWDFSQGEDWSR